MEDYRNAMYNAFEKELEKLSGMGWKGVGLVGLGGAGAVGAAQANKYYNLAKKEEGEQEYAKSRLRLQRLQAIQEANARFGTS